jgi:hypothetical protein
MVEAILIRLIYFELQILVILLGFIIIVSLVYHLVIFFIEKLYKKISFKENIILFLLSPYFVWRHILRG